MLLKETKERTGPMLELFRNTPEKPKNGTLVQGTVIEKGKKIVYIDIPPFGTGIIWGQEYLNARDIVKELGIGDLVTAKVVCSDGDNGYLELSLKEAKTAELWAEARRAIEHNTTFEATIKGANKGGLLLEWKSLDGFIPASQLKSEHYPRVPDGNKEKIAEELRKLIGQKLSVYLISADPKDGKLIFSEKALEGSRRKEIVARHNLGDLVEGEITGVVDFGLFIKIEEGLEGLIHISEVDWSLIENLKGMFQVGDKVKAKIIDIKDDKISLSVKALKPNPWIIAAPKYKTGQTVRGVVIKHNKHGALVSIEEGVAGLVHISELNGNEEEMKRSLELGKTYLFTIALFEPKEQRLLLSYRSSSPADNPEE